MILTEYERKMLMGYAATGANEWGMCSQDGNKSALLKHEQCNQLADLFSESPCDALPSEIRRCLRITGALPVIAFGYYPTKEEREQFMDEFDAFYQHMICRIREYQARQKVSAAPSA